MSWLPDALRRHPRPLPSGRELLLPGGDQVSITRTGAETAGALFEFEAVLPPRSSGPPPHRHLVDQESFHVVEGVLQVRLGKDVRHVEQGETVEVPPGTLHAFSNPTDRPVRLITRETPAGQLETQFRIMAAAGRLPPVLQLAELNAAHGYSFRLHGIPDAPQLLLWRGLAALARLTHPERPGS